MTSKLKIKFLPIITIIILVFMVVTTNLITTYYSKSNSLSNLKKSVILATKISQLIHETQKERGSSSGYISNHGLKFKDELLTQRVKTNEKITALKDFMLNMDNNYILEYIKKPLVYLKELKQMRILIDNLTINTTKEIKFYSEMNDEFIGIIVELSKTSEITKITKNLIAYSSFLYAKENAGIERALGTAILSHDKFEKSQRVYFTNLVAAQKLYLKTFLKFVSKDGSIFYRKTFFGKDIDIVRTIRNTIFSKDNSFNVEPKIWFKNITSKINKLKLVDNYLEEEILINIDNKLNKTHKLFYLFTFLNIFGIFAFVSVIIIVLKLTHNEKKLKQLNDKYIISSISDTNGKIVEVSDAFCNISGYKREELIGKSHSVIRHSDMSKEIFKELWKTIKQGKIWQGIVKNMKKDGSYYWVYTNIEPLLNKKGKITSYASIRLDITDSMHLQEELKKSLQKDKAMLQQSKLAQMGEMIAMIAHQWRQPLTAISSTSSDLCMKIMLENYDNEYFNNKLEKIDELSQHLSKTIDDFRGFYIEDKEKVAILFSEILKGALAIVSSSIENKNIILNTNCNCRKKIDTYPNELKQVILNLIKNAEDILLEKKVQKPTIDIKSYNDEKNSYLEVCDNGGGIPQNIIEKIFDPYFSTKTKKDGTGLGLYMSKKIIEEHCNGKLIVYNNLDGATFKISIPAVKG